MHNLHNPSQQYSKRQTRGEQLGKCPDEGLEPTYYFRIIAPRPLFSFLNHSMKAIKHRHQAV